MNIIKDQNNLPVCKSCGGQLDFQRWLVTTASDSKQSGAKKNQETKEERIFVCNNENCDLKGLETPLPVSEEQERLKNRAQEYIK